MKPKEIPNPPQTLGEHIKKKRLERKLTQKAAANLLGVTLYTVIHWEKGKTTPPTPFLPAITTFLGYDPFPPPATIAEQLKAKRRKLGWSLKRCARELGIDEGTLGDWERGKVILFKRHRKLVAEFLGVSEKEIEKTMKDRWVSVHQR